MGQGTGASAVDSGAFELSPWRVEPSRNLLIDGERQVSIEPKMMDVLVFLGERGGEVVTKEDIVDAVWPETFVTESVVTRAIVGLRKALGDSARSPRYIETIAKRGYRLILLPTRPPSEAVSRAEPKASFEPTAEEPAEESTESKIQGYPVGQWVSGPLFYGRSHEIEEIFEGHRSLIWLLGTRAIGKTSLLRQLEKLAFETSSPAPSGPGRYFPLYWDLQGLDSSLELHQDFRALLDDCEERLRAYGIELEAVDADDLFRSLRQLRRELKKSGRHLLLLIDEAEELIHLSRQDASLLRKLRRALMSAEGIRAVMASSSRLWQLAEQRDDTSPFLHGLAPPLHLGCLDEGDAVALVRQSQSPAHLRPPFTESEAVEFAKRGGNHPYLVQILCRETLDLGDLETATEAVAADPSVGFFFQVDDDLLSPLERALMRRLASSGHRVSSDQLVTGDESLPLVLSRLVYLERLGLIRQFEGPTYEVASIVRSRWLHSSNAPLKSGVRQEEVSEEGRD